MLLILTSFSSISSHMSAIKFPYVNINFFYQFILILGKFPMKINVFKCINVIKQLRLLLQIYFEVFRLQKKKKKNCGVSKVDTKLISRFTRIHHPPSVGQLFKLLTCEV